MANNYIDNLQEAVKESTNTDFVYAMLVELEKIEDDDINSDVYDARVLRQLHPEQRKELMERLNSAKENALKYFEAIDHVQTALTIDIITYNHQEAARREAITKKAIEESEKE